MKPLRLHVVVANIRNTPNLPAAQQLHDVRKARGEAGFVLWNEIGEKADHDAIDKAFPRKAWRHLYRRIECPTSMRRRRFKLVLARQVLLHHGSSQIPNPNRYLTITVVRPAWRPWLPKLAVLGTHWVNGAFTDAHTTTRQWRAANWFADLRRTQEEVAQLVGDGITVILGGDLNALADRVRSEGGIHEHARLVEAGGIVQLWAVEAPGGYRVDVVDKGRIGLDTLYTDHPIPWAHLALTKQGSKG